MPGRVLPIVYCETSWLVPLALPHHPHHPAAAVLRAEAGHRYDVRVPYSALLEARSAIERENKRLSDAAQVLQAAVGHLANLRVAGFKSIYRSLGPGARLACYLRERTDHVIDQLAASGDVTWLRDVPTAEMDEIRPQLTKIRGKDVADLFMLGSVVRDRRRESNTRRVIWCSPNRREFAERGRGGKCPDGFYDQLSIVYSQDFSVETALRIWDAQFASP